MKLIRLALTLAVTGLAVNLYLKNRRSASGAVLLLGYEPSAGDSAANLATSASAAAPAPGATAVQTDSLNGAERLQAMGVAETPSQSRADADPLQSNSQEGAFAQKPGLADFARGA